MPVDPGQCIDMNRTRAAPLAALLAAYAAATLSLLILDLLWIGVLAKPLYQQGIGHLMAQQPRVVPALLFYLIYPLGLMRFAVTPGGTAAPWRLTLESAAMFGFFAYATYDLSNLATLRDWPATLSLIDVIWGTVASTVAAVAGRWVLGRVGGVESAH